MLLTCTQRPIQTELCKSLKAKEFPPVSAVAVLEHEIHSWYFLKRIFCRQVELVALWEGGLGSVPSEVGHTVIKGRGAAQHVQEFRQPALKYFWFQHCRFNTQCTRPDCTFYHPTVAVPPRHALKWTRTQTR